ncbi:NAD-dependent epimerase/dehydratase family protein [Marinoscillum sp.]|uniref:NAD-dependent epimerase/dehydratase family protein n=1 Tax=Marinoscillum sp. TaxID=2024838 RepID=UPI003BAA8F00
MRVLVTGANGFLGSHIVERALHHGHEVFALLRKGSDTSNLQHLDGFKTVITDYSTSSAIDDSLQQIGKIDLVIHNAGLTKSYTLDRYLKVNTELTERLIEALQNYPQLSEDFKFAYVSSLAARGPVGNGGPASNYGISKLRSEEIVKNSGLNYLIFRPGGIYGPRDVQFVPLIKTAKLGIYPGMTPKHHKMTFIYASDAADSILACSFNHSNVIVHLEDGQIYEHDDLQKVLEDTLSKKLTKLIVGRPIVKSILFLTDIIDRNLGRTPTLSREHYSEISQDWNYDFRQERESIPLVIEHSLDKGFQKTVDYYRTNSLI